MVFFFLCRFTPGVGEVTIEDSVRRDIIQLLCVEPMSHSQLTKSIVDDIFSRDNANGLDKVVETVATFKKPKTTS